MKSSSNTRSIALWVVIAVAMVAIAWKLVARTAHEAEPVELPAHAVAEAKAPEELAVPVMATLDAVPAPAMGEQAPAPRAVPIVDCHEPGNASVYGFVRPAAGRDFVADEVHVSWIDRLGQNHATPVAEDGAYSFAGMQPGRYVFRAGSRSSGEARAEIDVRGERELDLQLEMNPEVRVRVVDAQGAPVPCLGVLAIATRSPPDTWIEEIWGSFDNPFGVGAWQSRFSPGERLPSDVLGRIVLHVEPPVYVSLVHYQYVVATQRVERGTSEVTFVVDPQAGVMSKGTLRVRPVDPRTNEPLKKGGLGIDGSESLIGATNPEGPNEYELAPGWYVIHVRAKDVGDPALRVRVEPGVVTDLGQLAVDTPVSIAGRVLDAEGKATATEVDFAACGPDGGPLPHVGAIDMVRSEDDGTFATPKLAPDRYRLNASGSDSQRWKGTVDARHGSVDGFEIRLARTTPLIVRFAAGAWEDARLRIVDAAGEAWYDGRLFQLEPYPIALVPGAYVVEYRPNPAAEPLRIPVTIADVPLELALP